MDVDVVMPEAVLSAVDGDELLARIDRLDPPVAIDVRAGRAGEALARSLLFEHFPALVEGVAGTGPLDDEVRFCNRYFWFVRFVALRQADHGPDAGLDQQAFTLLSEAPPGIDWALLEQLDTAARQI